MRPVPMQRLASFVPLPGLLADFGVAVEDVLAGSGLAAADLRADRFIEYSRFLQILDRAATLTGCDDFGLQLGLRQSAAALGPLGAVMRSAATLGEALADFAGFQIANASGGAVYLHRLGQDYAWGYGIYDAPERFSPHVYDLTLAIGSAILRDLTQGAGQPLEILALRPAPAQLGSFRSLGTCPIRFDQPQNAMVFRAETLALALPGADAERHAAGVAALLAAIDAQGHGVTGLVRHALRPMLLRGDAGFYEMAQQLQRHPRRLRRQLAEEGAVFEGLKEETRYSMARELLALTRLAAADIALSLGYASPSAFNRAFRRWSGTTPMAWRQNRLRLG